MELTKIEERKILPIAAVISAGKSKFLNVLLNINFLQSKTDIATKFVNIIRINPHIKEPQFYHIKIKEENGKYNFYKDPDFEVKVGEEKIIQENININSILSASIKTDYDDIFYMTEINEVKFIKDKGYLLTHDFCDIPGLSEYQSQATLKPENEMNLNKPTIENFGYQETNEPIVNYDKNKTEDDIYYDINIEENSYITEIFKRIKDYIDGAIIVLPIEKFYFTENFEIITKLKKVIKKDINNFLIILNKLDKSPDPISDINKCKGLFIQHFPRCRTFNLNLNTFVPISTLQLQNELLMNIKLKFSLTLKF